MYEHAHIVMHAAIIPTVTLPDHKLTRPRAQMPSFLSKNTWSIITENNVTTAAIIQSSGSILCKMDRVLSLKVTDKKVTAMCNSTSRDMFLPNRDTLSNK
mmetsp:Transcript_53725/g.143743  ORF Transcript_53725/g.143743 Transcript_53725/m.143743 type:complete len:100 (+) Transcript_53725:868-1167(+)